MNRMERAWHEVSAAASGAALAALEHVLILEIVAITGVGH